MQEFTPLSAFTWRKMLIPSLLFFTEESWDPLAGRLAFIIVKTGTKTIQFDFWEVVIKVFYG